MTLGFDCSVKLDFNSAKALKDAGYDYAARYLGPSDWSKTFDAAEAKAIQDAGLKLVSIYETNPTKSWYFTRGQGIEDAQQAYQYAKNVGQPTGSVIYFTVDYDTETNDTAAILDYVNGLKDTLQDYKVGLYGEFDVLVAVRGHVDFLWQTYAWSNSQVADFLHMYQFENEVTVAGIEIDKNEIKQQPGAWSEAAAQHTPQQAEQPTSFNVLGVVTIKGTNVRLRKGPGTEYDIIRELDGGAFKVLDEKDGWVNIGGWIYVDPSYIDYQRYDQVATSSDDGEAIVPYPGYLIKRGATGKDVQRIQRAVGADPDGVFGPITEQAVREYQGRHGLDADGIVGPKTWNMMF